MFGLKEALQNAVKRNPADGLLLSGGLDTSILACLSPSTIKTFTVGLESFGSDIRYAKLVAKHLGLKHYVKLFSVDEAIAAIPTVIKILHTFDPAIPNDVAIYFGLKFAKEHDIKTVMTGDGADELFAGYTYMHKMTNLGEYISQLAQTMYFSSVSIGKFFGIDVKQPYADEEFIKFATQIKTDLKVKVVRAKTWGKWLLRQTFKNILPAEIIWREKTAIEHGSGTATLRQIIASKISDDEFKVKQQTYRIKFRNKEHLFYYEIYHDVVGEIPLPKTDEKKCSWCGAGVKLQSTHCRICGGFPV